MGTIFLVYIFLETRKLSSVRSYRILLRTLCFDLSTNETRNFDYIMSTYLGISSRNAESTIHYLFGYNIGKLIVYRRQVY